MKFSYSNNIFALSIIIVLISSCSTGKTVLDSVTYYAVSNGSNTNYYRLKIENNSKLSKVSYKSGWYPSRAVDRLFGSVTSEEATTYLETQEILRAEYDKSIIKVNKLWLAAASDPNTHIDTLEKIMNARRYVLAYPHGSSPFPNSYEIEYNPEKGLAIHHADEKFIIAVAADPDEVMDNISSIAESDQTSLQIKNLSSIVRHRSANEITTLEAQYNVIKSNDSSVLASQIQGLLKIIDGAAPGTKQIINELESLTILTND